MFFQGELLSSMGGSSLGDTVRRMLRKIGTPTLWSQYNLKGRKGKLPFAETALYKQMKSKDFDNALYADQ